jgi:hypothetical protein
MSDCFYNTSGPVLNFGGASTWVPLAFSTPGFSTGWHHIVYTYNGSGAGVTSNFSVYIDAAIPASSGTTTPSARPNLTSLGNNGTGGAYFQGGLDDFRIYNRALDPWEIIQLYYAGLAGRRDAGMKVPSLANASLAQNNQTQAYYYATPVGRGM